MVKNIRETYMAGFLENKATISDITEFLYNVYDIELKEYELEEIKPYSRWKYNLDKQIMDIKNVVYINCYRDGNNEIKPFICGVTKTGNDGTTDFDFNKHANDETENYLITGRSFLNDYGFDYDTKKIYMFGCQNKQDAYLLERVIQNKFNLFGS